MFAFLKGSEQKADGGDVDDWDTEVFDKESGWFVPTSAMVTVFNGGLVVMGGGRDLVPKCERELNL